MQRSLRSDPYRQRLPARRKNRSEQDRISRPRLSAEEYVLYPFQVSDAVFRLRLPLRVSIRGEAVAIRDAADLSICCIYFDDGCPVRRSVRQRLTKKEAVEIGKAVARALTKAVADE